MKICIWVYERLVTKEPLPLGLGVTNTPVKVSLINSFNMFDVKALQARQAALLGDAYKLDMTLDKTTEIPVCIKPAYDQDGILSETGTMLTLDEDTEVYVRWDSPALAECLENGVVRRDQVVNIDGRLALAGSNRTVRTFTSKK